MKRRICVHCWVWVNAADGYIAVLCAHCPAFSYKWVATDADRARVQQSRDAHQRFCPRPRTPAARRRR